MKVTGSTKICGSCELPQPLSEFTKDRSKCDGLCDRCRTCKAASAKRYYARHKVEVNERAKEYKRLHPEVMTAARSKHYLSNRVEIGRKKREYEKANPKIKSAHRKVHNALASGRLKRLPCEVCGRQDSQAHHDDYSKPLEVRWLCSPHHNALHLSSKGESNGHSNSTPETTAARTATSEFATNGEFHTYF